MLVTLSDATEFEGGGTAFWSVDDMVDESRGGNKRGERDESQPGRHNRKSLCSTTEEEEERAPSLVFRPPAGAALIFGGTVKHAGQPVKVGRRCIFVASFSPCSAGASFAGAGVTARVTHGTIQTAITAPAHVMVNATTAPAETGMDSSEELNRSSAAQTSGKRRLSASHGEDMPRAEPDRAADDHEARAAAEESAEAARARRKAVAKFRFARFMYEDDHNAQGTPTVGFEWSSTMDEES